MKAIEINLEGVVYFVKVENQNCNSTGDGGPYNVNVKLYRQTMRSQPVHSETIEYTDEETFNVRVAKKFIKKYLDDSKKE